MKIKWYPEIHIELCNNCRKCLYVCNNNVLDIVQNKPHIVYPEDCMFECRKCSEQCGEKAISIIIDINL